MQSTAVPLVWTSLQKILFRFVACFFVLWIFPVHFVDSLVSSLPENKPAFLDTISDLAIGKVNDLYTSSFNALLSMIPQVKSLFPSDVNSYSEWPSYSFLLMIVFSSLIACLIWTAIDRKRKSYNQAYYWLQIFVRYFLAITMLVYGFSKIFCWQMSFPFPSNLVTMMGDYWPQKLAWNYMGYSKPFQIFCGFGEVTGGMLLFWRRTTLLGALILIPIITVVFMMNLCFDIIVKTESFAYLLMSIFLLLPYRKQLFNLFIKNNSSNPVYYPPAIKNPLLKKTLILLKYSFIVLIILSNIFLNKQNISKYRNTDKKPPIYGIYNTEHFVRNRDTIPLLITDTSIWKQMIFDEYGVTIKKMNDTCRVYTRRIDTITHTLKIQPYSWTYHDRDTLHKSEWHYEQNGEWLSLNGKYNGDSVQVLLKWYDHKKMRLPSWGFRWITR